MAQREELMQLFQKKTRSNYCFFFVPQSIDHKIPQNVRQTQLKLIA